MVVVQNIVYRLVYDFLIPDFKRVWQALFETKRYISTVDKRVVHRSDIETSDITDDNICGCSCGEGEATSKTSLSKCVLLKRFR